MIIKFALILCLVDGMSLYAMSAPVENSSDNVETVGRVDSKYVAFLNSLLECSHGRNLLGRFRFTEIIRDWESNDHSPGDTIGAFPTRIITTSMTYGENHMRSSRMQLDEPLYWREKPQNIVSALVYTISETESFLLQKKRNNMLIPIDSLFLSTRDNDIMLLCALLKWDPLLMPQSDDELRHVMFVMSRTHEQWCSAFPELESAYAQMTRILS